MTGSISNTHYSPRDRDHSEQIPLYLFCIILKFETKRNANKTAAVDFYPSKLRPKSKFTQIHVSKNKKNEPLNLKKWAPQLNFNKIGGGCEKWSTFYFEYQKNIYYLCMGSLLFFILVASLYTSMGKTKKV